MDILPLPETAPFVPVVTWPYTRAEPVAEIGASMADSELELLAMSPRSVLFAGSNCPLAVSCESKLSMTTPPVRVIVSFVSKALQNFEFAARAGTATRPAQIKTIGTRRPIARVNVFINALRRFDELDEGARPLEPELSNRMDHCQGIAAARAATLGLERL
jgi:hypothetical protein